MQKMLPYGVSYGHASMQEKLNMTLKQCQRQLTGSEDELNNTESQFVEYHTFLQDHSYHPCNKGIPIHYSNSHLGFPIYL